ncbi:hypothetical protein JVU11DRAFT_2484 [Chiua virens]|nr:hypothetical protein JVU11DRAFT_2484 [Chiua virens]
MLSLTTAAQNIAPRDPAAHLARLACSTVDLLWVMSYSPGEGDQGTLISVNFTCKADLAIGIHIRLVVGRRAVSTQVREIDSPGYGHWQLVGHAPSFVKQKSASAMVPLTIQAVDKENTVVDSVTFGDFVYNDIDNGDSLVPPVSPTYAHTSRTATNPPVRPTIRLVSGEGVDRSSKRHSPYSQPQTPPSSDSEYGSQGSRPHAQPVTQALRRASRQMGSEQEDTVILDITTPLDSFTFGWDESELTAGRRLVRFRRLQHCNRLIVSAESITQAEYDPEDIVISCIYRSETDSCWRLVDADFEVDEKNRIRRNLEGLRPTTVSKTRPGFEAFFQRIMDFPDPKPRKIEKDVKVFEWKLLPHALDKILSKYLAQFSSECISDPSPNMHRRHSLQEGQLQPVYLDTDNVQRFYPDPDIFYGVPHPSSAPLQSMYTADSPGMLAHDTCFLGNPQHDWATPTTNDLMLVSPQEPMFAPPYGYNPDSAEGRVH